MAKANSTRGRQVPVALYLRASSDDQTESIPAQRELLERYADDHGLEITKEYQDFAISGDSCKLRPGLQQLLADAKAGLFEGVLVRQLSRLSRRNSLKSAAQILGPLVDAGIEVYSASQGDLKLDTSVGRMMLSFFSEADHEENVSRSLNVLNGQLRAARNGSWIGMAPYGYRVEGTKGNKRLVFGDEQEVATVRRIFHMYADGETCEGIARVLNSEGIPSARGGKWTRDTIRDMLDRPAFVGDHRYNFRSEGKYYELKDGKPVERRGHWIDDDQERAKSTVNSPEDWIYIPDHWPAIVDRETWDRVQRRLAHNSENKPGPTDKTFVLTGVLRCTCGCSRDMYGKFRAGKKRYQCDGCGGWVVEHEVLEAIGRGVQRSVTPEVAGRLRAELERRMTRPEQPAVNIKSLEKKLAKYQKRLLECSSDTVEIVENEIRSLRRSIEQAQRAARQADQRPTRDFVDRVLGYLFKLPDVLREADEKRLKARLAEMVDCVCVTSKSTGAGKGMRWSLAGGEAILTCRGADGVELPFSWVSSRRLCRWTTGSCQ